jgi:hypothetical protein
MIKKIFNFLSFWKRKKKYCKNCKYIVLKYDIHGKGLVSIGCNILKKIKDPITGIFGETSIYEKAKNEELNKTNSCIFYKFEKKLLIYPLLFLILILGIGLIIYAKINKLI